MAGHVEVTHNVFDQFTSILNHFRHHNQHLTHLLLTLDILHRASRAYHNFTQLYILSFKICSALCAQFINYSILLDLRHARRAYHNFTQFCTFLASKFAARFARNSSIYCWYISSSILLLLLARQACIS